ADAALVERLALGGAVGAPRGAEEHHLLGGPAIDLLARVGADVEGRAVQAHDAVGGRIGGRARGRRRLALRHRRPGRPRLEFLINAEGHARRDGREKQRFGCHQGPPCQVPGGMLHLTNGGGINSMRHVYGWLLLTPAAILLIGFTHYPAAATLLDSFFSTGTVVRPSRFVGLANYAALADDPVFVKVLLNNFWFALGTIPTSIALALLMALWVNDRVHGLPLRALARMAYFTPTILPMIAVANLWLFFYTPQIGLLDQLTGLFGAPSHNWLGDPHTVMGCLVAMTIWKESGFFMIFYLAALQSLPPELEEAGRIEGASRWTFFRRVTFPLLMPTTLFVLVNATINSFKLVDQ